MKVCVVKVGGLGDTLSVLPLVEALGAAGAEVSVLGGPAAVLLPAARVVTVPRQTLSGPRGLRRAPGLARRLGRQDVALLSFDECSTAHAVAALVARRRVGFAAGIARGERLLTERLPFDAQRPVADLALDLGRHLLGRLPPRVPVPPRPRGSEVLLFPEAATPLQRWPGFEALEGTTLRMGDGLDPAALATRIGAARVVVSNHSGPLHLAAALGVPHVAVAGPTARAWDPVGSAAPGRVLRAGLPCQPCGRVGAPARHCPHGLPPPCLTAVTAGAVRAAMVEVAGD